MKHIYLSRKGIKAVQCLAAPDDKIQSLFQGVCVEATALETRVIGSSRHTLAISDFKTRNTGVERGERINFVLTPLILDQIPNRADSKDVLVIVIGDRGKFELFDWGTKIDFAPWTDNYARACQWLFKKQ